MFLEAKISFLSFSAKTIKTLSFLKGNFSKTWFINFVLGFSSSILSNIVKKFSFAFKDKVWKSAFLLIFFGTIFLKFLSLVGPNVTPPPFHMGERIEPALALPVPFCFQGFFPPPLTSPLPLV